MKRSIKLTHSTIRALLAFCLCLFALNMASAAEYRLIINDSASCRANGKTGPDCIVPASASTSSASSSTSTPSTSSGTTSTSTSSGGSSSGGCTVTVWNPCANGSGSSTSTSSTNTASSSSNTSSTPATTTTTTTTTASTSSGSGGGSTTAQKGTLDYGSGGFDATGNTTLLRVNSGGTALPFTVVAGSYSGRVGITPSSLPFPDDGSEVRMWWSETSGGSPLAGSSCSGNLGSEGFLYWDQSGKQGYGCVIPNQNATLYLNVKLCISNFKDSTCSASDAKNSGSEAPVYLSGTKRTR